MTLSEAWAASCTPIHQFTNFSHALQHFDHSHIRLQRIHGTFAAARFAHAVFNHVGR